MLTMFLFGMVTKGQIAESRTAAEFSRIEIRNATLFYMESDTTSIRVEAQNEAECKQLKTQVVNGTLKIGNTQYNPENKVKVYVSAKNISFFKAADNAIIEVSNQLTVLNLKVVLQSGASFSGNINAKNKVDIEARKQSTFRAKIQSQTLEGHFKDNAKIILCGSTEKAVIHNADRARCNARNLVTHSLTVRAEGSSEAWIYSNKYMAIEVTDSAKVIYNGIPQKLSLNLDAIAFGKKRSETAVSYQY